jgi:acyl-CoA synthetase (NDP forming)
LVTDHTELIEAVRRVGQQVVLKLQAPELLHKSDIGAVRIGVTAESALADLSEMLERVHTAAPGAALEGVLVQQLVGGGVELIVGVQSGSEGYPATVTVGLGGTLVELYRDVVTAFAPVEPAEAERMLRSLRGAPLLTGYRGRPLADLGAAANAVAALSRTVMLPGIREVEVNPLIVFHDGEGVSAVDLVVRRDDPGSPP